MQSNMSWLFDFSSTSTTHSFDSAKGHLTQYPSANLALCVLLFLLPFNNESLSFLNLCALCSFTALSNTTVSFPFPSQHNNDKSTPLALVPPYATVWMIYGSSWRLNKRPQRDRHRREENEALLYIKRWTERNFLFLSLLCNFSETDKW